MPNLNSSTNAYLKQYLSKNDPGFAVMLTAPWGAGKTHLIKALIDKFEDDKPLYISLFGVGTRAEFDRAIVRAFWPMSNESAAKLVRQLKNLVSGINVFGNSINLNNVDLTEVIMTKLPDTLVFDDLERATLPPSEILGAINNFVEHEGKRVVLLANETILWDDETLKEKEKVVGRTLSVVADIDSALGPIISQFDTKTGNFYTNEIEVIAEVFGKAGYNNLRSLGQALWEFERLFKEIDNKFLNNATGMRELLFVYLALTLEIKAGNFTREDMQLRGGMDYGNKPEYEKLRSARAKYESEQIQYGRHQTVLPHNFAVSILCDGAIDKAVINETLTQTPAFHEATAESEWETVWWAFDREKNAVELAVPLMEEKFANREYVNPGVILSVFSSRLDLSDMGFSSLSMTDVEVECSQYICDLKDINTLPAYDPVLELNNDLGYGYSDTGYMSLGFPRDENYPKGPHFNRLYEQMKAAQFEVYEDTGPEVARSLLELMKTDVDAFMIKVSGNIAREATHAWQPVLKHLPTAELASDILDLPQKERKKVLKSLAKRYEKQGKELESEKAWLTELAGELDVRLDGMGDFLKWQISIDLKHSIGKVVGNWAALAKENEAEAEVQVE